MDEFSWYSDASLRLPGRVLCAGTLAQCVRRWMRLSDKEKEDALLTFAKSSAELTTVGRQQIAQLAEVPALRVI
jgi:hypothetical protein